MKPSKPSKSRTGNWTQRLDERKVLAAFEDAIVDAHDEDEQHSGLLAMVESELAFPFRGKVLGEPVTLVSMEWPEDDEFGLDLVCERNGERHRVEARSVEFIPPLPKGHLYLAAYLCWKGTL